ncbi:MAG: ABC transporter ATP-binding protein/permease [Desulfobacterales bacterium]|jgi:ATP-binding cassette subfamily C protein|nr:ABC transporter ATP-binding protein/permease [Desulfobacterales bacterium]
MTLFISLARRYPWQTLLTLAAISFAGLAEGFGISALLPLLNTIFSQRGHLGGSNEPAAEWSNRLDQLVQQALAAVGLQPTVAVLLALFTAFIVLKCALIYLANKQIGFTVVRVATDLRLALLKSLFASKWEYFIRQPTGKLTNAVATEATRASTAFHFGAKLSSLVIEASVYTALAFMVSWEATVVALGAGVFIIVLLRRLVQKNRRAGAKQTQHTQSLIAQMTDVLISIKPLKAMAREQQSDTVLTDTTRRLNRALQKQVLSKAALGSFQEPILILFLVLLLYTALVYWNQPLTTMIAMVFFIGRILKQVEKIQKEYVNLVEYESAYWSLQAKIDEARSAREVLQGDQTPALTEGIRIESLSFAYNDTPVLRDATLAIPAGSFVALLGASGSGKTTLVDMLIGLLRPQKGDIWIDDVPLPRIDIRHWRQMIGYVPQENLLMHDTVMANVTLGDDTLTEADVESALRAAGAWGFVQGLPRGIHTVVGERGSMVSGGQRQRIAIARALVKRPKLLILDEATTALDPETEKEICSTLQQLAGGITILAISHQTALREAAGWVYQVADGTVALIQSPPAA